MNVSYLCLGGNIGNRESSLEQALGLIHKKAGQVTTRSGLYETEAWGVSNQQAYLNQCICLHTNLEAGELLETLLSIEEELGRQRNGSATYEPRTIDIDILFFNDTVINSGKLIVPHPRLHLRKFVLVPLAGIAPDYLHPVLNKTIFSLLNECPDTSRVTLYK
jgi:2-amino-4-hydroxy-6-hydroxymethyldihydropteridine diphosphokinase